MNLVISFTNINVGTNASRTGMTNLKGARPTPLAARAGQGKHGPSRVHTVQEQSLFWEKAIGSLANLEIYFLDR